MRVPVATYRLQLNAGFDFERLKGVAPYLAGLGIADIYASPIFKAKKGSSHGYDAVHPRQINPELGGAEGFDSLMATVQEYRLGWLQDIVPNHMSFDFDNEYLMNVMENGQSSTYFS